MYETVGAGTTFTGTAGINFWLLFEATKQTSGEFVFTLWFKETAGEGQEPLPAAGGPNDNNEEPQEPESVFEPVESDCVDGFTLDGVPCDEELADDNINGNGQETPEDENQE